MAEKPSYQELEIKIGQLEKELEGLKKSLATAGPFPQTISEDYKKLFVILESINAPVYVSDMDTHEILYINGIIKKQIGDIVGKKCWQALQLGQKGPCPFCTNNRLLDPKGKPARPYIWEFKNELIDKWFKCIDSAILWPDGRTVRLEIAIDITDSKKKDIDLKKQADHLKKIIDSVNFFMGVLKPDGTIIDASKNAIVTAGLNASDIIGKPFHEIYWPDSKPKKAKILRAIKKAARGQGSKFDIDVKTQGYDMIVTLSITPLFDDKGTVTHIVPAAYDITYRKEIESELRKSEEKYRNIIENIREAYYEVDLQGNMTFFNKAAVKILEFPEKKINGLNYTKFTSKDKVRDVYKTFNKVFTTQIPVKSFDWEITTKNGRKKHLKVSISLIKDKNEIITGFRGIAHDVTEEKRVETELVHTKDFLESIIESSIDGIATTDIKGNLTFLSPSIESILGFEHNELIGEKVYHCYGNGIEDAKEIMKNLTSKGALKDYFLSFIKKNGDKLDISLSASLLKNEQNEVIGTLGIYRDITRQKQLEFQLYQTQKMKAIGTLAGGIAHDFNNILMGIQGNTSLILFDIDEKHPYYKKLKTIETLTQSGAQLTKQLLGFARGGKYEIKPVNINEIIQKSIEMFLRTNKHIKIRSKLKENIWITEADPNQLEQVLLNLFINALQAMPHGGDIFVTTDNIKLDKSYIKSFQIKPGNYIKIEVTDTGLGMDEKTQKRIFEPFFTTKKLGKGTGMGLASAYGIIKNHKGLINVYSEIEKGSTFKIYLPASTKKVSMDKKMPDKISTGDETILIIDDEDTIIEVAKEMLQNLKYEVITANGGKNGIKIFKKNHDKIDLIILDIIMPDINGPNVYSSIIKINPDAKVLVSSGFSINKEAKLMIEKGCKGFIQKPFDIFQLSNKIREIIDN